MLSTIESTLISIRLTRLSTQGVTTAIQLVPSWANASEIWCIDLKAFDQLLSVDGKHNCTSHRNLRYDEINNRRKGEAIVRDIIHTTPPHQHLRGDDKAVSNHAKLSSRSLYKHLHIPPPFLRTFRGKYRGYKS
jgi:hypothetical protein